MGLELMSIRPFAERFIRRARTAASGFGGSIDLASVIAGIVVSAIVGSSVFAVVFLIIPWSQDESAKTSLRSTALAESVYFSYYLSGYGSLDQLRGVSNATSGGTSPQIGIRPALMFQTSQKPFLEPPALPITITASKTMFIAGVTSVTGNQFWITADSLDILTAYPSAGIDLGAANSFSLVAGVVATVPGSSFPAAVWAAHGITDDANTVYGMSGYSASENDGLAALAAAKTAYSALSSRATTGVLSGDDLAGQTITPGTYHRVAAYAMTTPVTLDAQGDPDAVFIFQGDAALNTTAGTSMNLINGAEAKNIFWVMDEAVTLGASSKFYGTIISNAAVTVGASTLVYGRVISTNAAVTLDANIFLAF